MKVKEFVENPWFSRVIMFCILINAILIGLETYPSIYATYSTGFEIMDIILLSIFTIEIFLKLITYKGSYFRNGWNVIDFSIVALSLLFMGSNFVSVLRIVRVLRVLRTLSAFPSLRRMVNALFLSLPAMGSTFMLMVIVFYIYGIVGNAFFATISPVYFGSLQYSLLTLFQVFTLEAWASEVFRPIFVEIGWSWMYFASFIIISAFIVANIFFGELVTNAQKISEEIERENADIDEEIDEVHEELTRLKEQNEQLHQKLDVITALLHDKVKIG